MKELDLSDIEATIAAMTGPLDRAPVTRRFLESVIREIREGRRAKVSLQLREATDMAIAKIQAGCAA